ncbi:MAG: C40 family peptidase, partial [Gemmatimonadota bacterium]
MKRIHRLVADVRAEYESDPRTTVFDVRVERRGGRLVLTGETTEPGAADALYARVAAESDDLEVDDEIVRLPDPALGSSRWALVRAAVAPVHAAPKIASTQVSQFVLGHRLDLLSKRDGWYRVRGEDGYIGWVHHGFVETGEMGWARAWELGDGGEPVVSLGGDLVDEAGRTFARLPWGARLFRDTPNRLRLPDGRRGALGDGEVVAVDRMPDRFPPSGESAARTARRWVGTPYLWGGVTRAGADCSGFVQAAFWMHGVALPRDSDLQATIGEGVEPGETFEALRAGDLLFFTEREDRVTHVAISLGGPHIIHCSLA